jgi:hypothetical protein
MNPAVTCTFIEDFERESEERGDLQHRDDALREVLTMAFSEE